MEPTVFDSNLIRFIFLFAAAAGLVGMFVGLSAWLGPKRTSKAKELPFECGHLIESDDSRRPFPIKYYLVAILFIVFDIEVAFMYPWAINFRMLGGVGFISMMFFLLILGVGLFYAVKKRVLDWK
jgi:NADH-quinone oxidoreductase subunit A